MNATPNFDGSPLSDEELAAWHGMLQLRSQALQALDAALSRAHHLSVREFDVLITLFNGPDSQLRMSALAQRVMLSPSGLTRLVERLERSGLVRRQPDPDDARSYRAGLTDAGQQRLDEARPTHNAVIRCHFLDHLSPEEVQQLGALWVKIQESSRLPAGDSSLLSSW